MKTAEQWLAMDDKLPGELAKVFTPRPWKHEWINSGGIEHCKICRTMWSKAKDGTHCTRSIVIDWNTAMEWFRQYSPRRTILRQVCGPAPIDCISWFLVTAQPKHYLIAAAMSNEKE